MRRGRPRHDDILTPPQWQVLVLLREGLTNEQIGARLGLTADGAKYHVSEILSKLGLTSREEAAAWAAVQPRQRHLLGVLGAMLSRRATLINFGLGSAVVTVVAGLALLFVLALDNRNDDVIAGPLGKLAYIQGGNVWVKALPDGAPYRLTNDGHDAVPSWSWSGEWLLFLNRRAPPGNVGGPTYELWVIKPDGNGRRRLDSLGPGGRFLVALHRPADALQSGRFNSCRRCGRR